MDHRRVTYHIVRPTRRIDLPPDAEHLIARSRERYARTVELHAFAYRPGKIELIATASRRAQLDGFVGHLFRALSRANRGSLLLGRISRTRVLEKGEARSRLLDMQPHLLLDRPLPAKLGGQLDLQGV